MKPEIGIHLSWGVGGGGPEMVLLCVAQYFVACFSLFHCASVVVRGMFQFFNWRYSVDTVVGSKKKRFSHTDMIRLRSHSPTLFNTRIFKSAGNSFRKGNRIHTSNSTRSNSSIVNTSQGNVLSSCVCVSLFIFVSLRRNAWKRFQQRKLRCWKCECRLFSSKYYQATKKSFTGILFRLFVSCTEI